MRVTFRPVAGAVRDLDVDPSTTVAAMKATLGAAKLIFSGRVLDVDTDTLGGVGVADGGLVVFLPAPGGTLETRRYFKK